MEDRENKETHLGDTEYRNLTKIDLASFNTQFSNWAYCQKLSRSFFLHSATMCHDVLLQSFSCWQFLQFAIILKAVKSVIIQLETFRLHTKKESIT